MNFLDSIICEYCVGSLEPSTRRRIYITSIKFLQIDSEWIQTCTMSDLLL